MAKYVLKGKKVTGTKKKDKITWQKSWKKNLTVDGLAGADTIDFSKSKKKITYIGGKGNDVIKTGSGSSTIIINRGDGNDTIYTKGKATLVKFNTATKNDKMSYSKSGKDLILTYNFAKSGSKKAAKSVVTFKNYFNANGTVYKDNITLQTTTKNKITKYLNDLGLTMTAKYETTFQGTPYRDTITGTFGQDKIYGSANNDKIDGNGGNDVIDGGDGNDIIYGRMGNDKITGGNGNDVIYPGGGTNIIDAGAGNDTISVTDGENTINAGADNDMVSVEGGVNVINMGAGNNDIHIHRPQYYLTFENTVVKGDGTDTLFLDNLTSFDQYSAEYDGNNLNVFDSAGDVVLQDFKNGHSVKYVSINGETRQLEVTLSGTDGADTISATTGAREILIGGDGADTYEFQCGPWDTVFTSSNITHSTIVMGTDDSQDTINILTDKNSNGILLRKNGNNMVIWYKQQYYPDTDESNLDDGIYQIDGKDTYVYNGTRYFASITVKDYFINDNPTVDRIVMGIPGGGEPNEYSITSLYNNYVDLGSWSEGDYAGTYDQENRKYTGTKYNDYIYTQKGTGDGDTIYAGAGNDTIYTWGRTDSAYGQDGNDVIYGNPKCQILDGGTGNDIISVSTSPSQPEGEYVTIFGGKGSDNITVGRGSVRIYTNSETGDKDTTEGVVDTITINASTSARSKFYAQSETNIIVNNNDWEDDDYFAYIDQTTFITESHGADEDSLTILNAAHTNLHIAFNMRNKNTGIEDDTLWILDDANYTKWQANMNDTTIKGINIKGDDICKIERINASDGYYLGQTQLMQLESAVSNWLNSYNPSGYTYVSDVLATENKDTIITLIANNTNWQSPSQA